MVPSTRQSKKARLLLVDDFEVIRTGLKNLLSEHREWEVCGEAENGRIAVQKVSELSPDLVFMDISMPVMNGLEAARQIRNIAPSTKIVIFSMHDSSTMAEEAMQAGADAYLLKTSSLDAVEKAIGSLLNAGQSSTV